MTKKTLNGNTCAGDLDLATFLRGAKGVEFAVFIHMWPDHFDDIDAAHDEMLDLILALLETATWLGCWIYYERVCERSRCKCRQDKQESPSVKMRHWGMNHCQRCIFANLCKKKDIKWREKPSRSASICFLCRILESSASCLRHCSWMYVVLGLIKQTYPPTYQMDSHMNCYL